jgi:hypothetical protein
MNLHTSLPQVPRPSYPSLCPLNVLFHFQMLISTDVVFLFALICLALRTGPSVSHTPHYLRVVTLAQASLTTWRQRLPYHRVNNAHAFLVWRSITVSIDKTALLDDAGALCLQLLYSSACSDADGEHRNTQLDTLSAIHILSWHAASHHPSLATHPHCVFV